MMNKGMEPCRSMHIQSPTLVPYFPNKWFMQGIGKRATKNRQYWNRIDIDGHPKFSARASDIILSEAPATETVGGCVRNEWFVHFHQLPVSDEGLHGVSCWGWMDGFNFQMWFLAGCPAAIGEAKDVLNSAKK